ncbi:MAG TPA: O-antigen ligase family protein [Sphingomicrobium sp.]|nr:O-antigen ligase family protein [Sphingomicrobium sp.]
MPAPDPGTSHAAPSDWLLLALIAALPLMKPPLSYPVVLPDILLLLLVGALAFELLLRRRRIEWTPANWVLIAYGASLAPSLLASGDVASSLIKLAGNFYLVILAGLTASLVDSEAKLRRAIMVWLGATAAMVLLAPLSVAAFTLSSGSALLDYASYGFGSLPPGNYPRLALTFINANMMCNYLTVSLGLLLAANRCGWIARATFYLLLAGILFAALTSLSPGLGGIALLAGLWAWLTKLKSAPRIAKGGLAAGIALALLFVVALAVTPVVYPAAPFLIRVPLTDTLLAPSGRFLTWTSAAHEFLRQPLVGHGIGVDAAAVTYPRPDGFVEQLTDAHNLFLSIAAQAGLLGLAGLAAVIALAIRLTGKLQLDEPRGTALRLALGLSFLDAFVYQGFGGSFEDTRHLWVLLGLLIAARRLSFTRPDGNNRTPAGPSPG